MARIKYYDASSNSWKYADKAGSTVVTVDGITAIPAPDTASVGQTVVVTEVDENGKPVVWEAVDFPDSATGGAFYFTVILEEDVSAVSLQMPVNWGRIIQFNIHADIMGQKLTAEMALQTKVGNYYSNQNPLPANFKGLDYYGIRYMWDDLRTYFALGRSTVTSESDQAVPTLSAFKIGPENNQDHFRFTSKTEGVMFPKGMRFDVWGVYA